MPIKKFFFRIFVGIIVTSILGPVVNAKFFMILLGSIVCTLGFGLIFWFPLWYIIGLFCTLWFIPFSVSDTQREVGDIVVPSPQQGLQQPALVTANEARAIKGFIRSSRMLGCREDEINKQLISSGWTKEQISEAITFLDPEMGDSLTVPQSFGLGDRINQGVDFFFKNWMIYQRERFPLIKNGVLILVFSSSAVSYSYLVGPRDHLPSVLSYIVAYLTCLSFFMLLRIADEFKDYEEDCRFRPYRSVPRGLITLRQLGWLAGILMALQFFLAISLAPKLLFFLGIAWCYLYFCSKEFFVREWLKKHIFIYMALHMLILPIIDFYATACEWMPRQGSVSMDLGWFIVCSFFNGFVIEIGRKIRAPEDEEEGVETYSALWTPDGAAVAWMISILCAGGSIILAGLGTPSLNLIKLVIVTMVLMSFWNMNCYWKTPQRKYAQRFEGLSGLWICLSYAALGYGIFPLILKASGVLDFLVPKF